MNDLLLDDQDSIDGDEMGLLKLFEEIEENSHSPLTGLFDEGSNKNSKEDIASKTQAIKGIHYVNYSYY